MYRSLRSSDPSRTFDPIASRRSAIEQREQDRHRRAIDVLIDAARDCIETALSADPLLAQGYLDKWSRSPDTILRRLAVHGWRMRTDQGPDKKLAWLREEKLLWDIELKHEVFQLIRDALPIASDAAARSLIDDASAGPPNDDGNAPVGYRGCELLGWITDSVPDLSIAATALEKAQQEHPEYAREEHPDFGYYGSFGTVENALPFTPEELHELIAQDPTEALARLRKFSTRRHELKGPTWTGALQSLQACVTTYPKDSVLVAQALKAEDSDIRAALIDSWAVTALGPELIEQALTITAGWNHDEIREPACAMLSNGGNPGHPTAWHQIEQARHLAAGLWPTSDDATSGGAGIRTRLGPI